MLPQQKIRPIRPSSSPRRLESLKILLVEDDLLDARTFEHALRQGAGADFEVHLAASLDELPAALARERFDLVVLDIELPDSSGLESVRKAVEIAKETPVVVLTRADDAELALRAVASGAQDYLIKGENPLACARAMRFAVERREWATERARIESFLALAERQNGMRWLSDCVLAEFDDLLTSANGRAELLLADGAPNEAWRAGLRALSLDVRKAAKIVAQVSRHGRLDEHPQESCDARDVILDLVDDLAFLDNASIRLVAYIEPMPTAVDVSADSLRQILLNLVMNAWEAMRERKGDIRLSLSGVYEGTRAPGVGRPDRLQFVVADHGPGFCAESLARGTEPFYTTKPDSAGLGLSAAAALAKAAGGSFELTNHNAGGARVIFELPSVQPEP